MFPIKGWSDPEFWYVADAPNAPNIRAAVTKIAPGATKRLVITGALFNVTATGSTFLARIILNNDVNGQFTNIIADARLFTATSQAGSLLLAPLNIALPLNTPASAQFFAAGTNATQSVSLFGYTLGRE